MGLKIDKALILTILFMLGLGLVQVYSSSFIFATETFGDGQYFFRRQLIFVVLSIAVLIGCLFTPWMFFEKIGWLLWLTCLGLLALTLVPELGVKAGGATRWLPLFSGFRFEPGEMFKYTTPFIVALFLEKNFLKNIHLLNDDEQRDWNLLLLLLLLITASAILLKQPDFGTFAIVMLIAYISLFVFGLKWRYVLLSLLSALPIFYFYVYKIPYRWARVKAFLNPWQDPEQNGFQVLQSMLSFYAGGVWGVGLGQGQGQLFFLPAAHTDFTLAVWGEEMGFIGVVFILLLYGFLIFRGFQIFSQTQRLTAKIVAWGVSTCLAISVFINIGVTVGMLPPKGLTLPFLSYGGSSLVATCFGLGLLLCIDRFNRKHRALWRSQQGLL